MPVTGFWRSALGQRRKLEATVGPCYKFTLAFEALGLTGDNCEFTMVAKPAGEE
jgi:hypothetical protein